MRTTNKNEQPYMCVSMHITTEKIEMLRKLTRFSRSLIQCIGQQRNVEDLGFSGYGRRNSMPLP